jgi:hypothetical protein
VPRNSSRDSGRSLSWRAQVSIFIGTLGVILAVFLFSAVTEIVSGITVSYVPEVLAAITGAGGFRMAQTAYTETRYASSYASMGQTPPAPSVGFTSGSAMPGPPGG